MAPELLIGLWALAQRDREEAEAHAQEHPPDSDPAAAAARAVRLLRQGQHERSTTQDRVRERLQLEATIHRCMAITRSRYGGHTR